MIPVARMAREGLALNFMGALVITLMCYWVIA